MNMHRDSVLITGASTGVGRCCAIRFANNDYQVFAGVRSNQDGDNLIRESNGAIEPIILDVTKPESIQSAKKYVSEKVNQKALNALINNAGISIPGPFETMEDHVLNDMIAVNLLGLILTTRVFIPFLRKTKGRIINIGSLAGRIAIPFFSTYSATKFGVRGFTSALRVELQSLGVKVILVEPGNINTPLWEKAIKVYEKTASNLSDEYKIIYGNKMALFRNAISTARKKGCSPEHVAEVVEKILSARKPKSEYLVGSDTTMMAIIAGLVPARLRDSIIARVCKLEEK